MIHQQLPTNAGVTVESGVQSSGSYDIIEFQKGDFFSLNFVAWRDRLESHYVLVLRSLKQGQ